MRRVVVASPGMSSRRLTCPSGPSPPRTSPRTPSMRPSGSNVGSGQPCSHARLPPGEEHTAVILEGYKCKKGHFIASVNWFVGNFRGKVPIECYIRLFQSYCSMAQFYGHYMIEVLTIFA